MFIIKLVPLNFVLRAAAPAALPLLRPCVWIFNHDYEFTIYQKCNVWKSIFSLVNVKYASVKNNNVAVSLI